MRAASSHPSVWENMTEFQLRTQNAHVVRRLVLVLLPIGALIVVPAMGCGDDKRACVKHVKTSKTPDLYYCLDLAEEEGCSDSPISTTELHEGQSCSDLGYEFLCTEAETKEHGLQGGPTRVANADCNPTIPPGGGGSSGGGSNCGSSVWTCPNDGQATPTCQYACTFPSDSSERSQTCKVLASMLENGNAGECCTVCR